MKPSISATHCSMHLVFVRNDKYDISYIYIYIVYHQDPQPAG